MTDLATLGVRLDTTEAADASEVLDNFAKASQGAENAVNSLGDTASRASGKVADYASEMEQAYGISERLSDSERMVIQALEDQINFISLTREEQYALNAIRMSGTKVDSEARVVIEGLARSYARLADTQKAAAAQRANTAQQEFMDMLAPQTGKSAKSSASVFIEDYERIETEMRRVNEAATLEFNRLAEIARVKAKQAGENFYNSLTDSLVPGTQKSARESANVFIAEFNRLDAIAREKAAQVAKTVQAEFDSFLTSNSGKSAADSAAVFKEDMDRADEELRRLAEADNKKVKQIEQGQVQIRQALETALKEEIALRNRIAKARAEQDGANFRDDLNRRLGIGAQAKSARDSASVFFAGTGRTASSVAGLNKGDVRDLVQILQMSSGPLGAFGRGIGNITFGLGRFGIGVIGAVAGFAALGAAAAKAVQSYRQLEDAQIRVSNRLALTGGASGQNNESIEALVQRNARFGQNLTGELRDAAAELLKFRNVSGETFTQALELANRFSQTGLMKVGEAARLMGSALKNPVEGVQQLRDAGLSLSPVLEDNIRKLYEQGRVLDAQKALYSAVASQLGGVTGGQGLSGAITQLSNSTGSFFEKFGSWVSAASGLEGELRRLANVIDFLTGATDRASKSSGLNWFFRSIALAAGNTRPMADALTAAARNQANQRAPRNAAEAERRINDQLGNPESYQRMLKAQQDAARGFQTLDQAIAAAGRAKQEQKDRIDAVTLALNEEMRVAGMNAVQQRIDSELRKAGVNAMSAEGQAIAKLIRGIEGLTFAREALDDARRRRGDAEIELRTVNMSAEAGDRYRFVQEKVNEAKIRGISLSPQFIANLDKEAASFAKVAQAAREAQLIKDLSFERAQLARTEIEQQIASALRQAGDVDPNSASGQFISNMVRVNEELRRSKELVQDFGSTFASEFRNAIREGENFWSAFSSAGLKALQRVADKLMDMALNDLITKAFGGMNLFSMFSGGTGGSVGMASTGFDAWSGLRMMANGGVFAGGNLMRFANGAAFTNSIVEKPTLFPFANGTGLMGEAGPEAIMPLRRLPSGRLGVESSGGGSKQTAQLVRVIVESNDEKLRVFVRQEADTAFDNGIQQYDRGLPDRVQQIDSAPYRRQAG